MRKHFVWVWCLVMAAPLSLLVPLQAQDAQKTPKYSGLSRFAQSRVFNAAKPDFWSREFRAFAGDAAEATAMRWTEQAQLLGSDSSSYHFFGNSVAISGNTAVVGAPGYEDFNGHSVMGAAYVFVKSGTDWQSMVQTAKLLPADGSNCSTCYFAYSVAISGNTIAVGSDSGEVHLYQSGSGTWTDATEIATISNGMGGTDFFGNQIALTGNTLVVGAPESGQSQGTAYVFVQPASGWVSTSQPNAVLTASDGQADDLFAASVTIAGNSVLVGAPTKPYPQQYGALYVFVRPSTGWKSMTETAKLTAKTPSLGALLGWSLTSFGNAAIAGAPTGTDFPGPGAAYVFVRPAGGWKNASENAILSDGTHTVDSFGVSVSLSGNTLLVGASSTAFGGNQFQGAAYSFRQPTSGWMTTSKYSAKLREQFGEAEDAFGHSVNLDHNTAIIGAYERGMGT